MPLQNMQPAAATDAESGFQKAAVPSPEYIAAENPCHKKRILRRNILALSTDLALAATLLADRAGEIVNFAYALPHNCGREEAAERISMFIESLCPASSALQFRRSFHPGLGQMLANRSSLSYFPWILSLAMTVLLVLTAVLMSN